MRRLRWDRLSNFERLAGAAMVALGLALVSTSWDAAGYALVAAVVGGGSVLSTWRQLGHRTGR